MDIRQLRYFLEIVEQGSITRAAVSLNVAQPALSLHVKNMEARLGARLLNRSRSGVTPTEAGALLMRRARGILHDLARTEDDIRTLDTDPSGVVRIGLPGTISEIVSLPLIEAVRDRFPGIRLNIAEAMSGFIFDWLTESRVDLAILYSASGDDDFVSEPLLEEELVVLWPAEADVVAETSLAGLRDVPLVLPSGAHGLRDLIERALQPLDVVPKVAVEIDSYSIIKSLVAAGYGASILPSHAVRDEVRAGALTVSRIADPGLWRAAHLVSSAGRPATRAQQVVRDLLRDLVSELTETGRWAGARPCRAV